MGVVRCGKHGCKCCWRCDRCPRCQPETGRLRRGDYCADCVAKFKAEGFVWSTYFQNWIDRKDAEMNARFGWESEEARKQGEEEGEESNICGTFNLLTQKRVKP